MQEYQIMYMYRNDYDEYVIKYHSAACVHKTIFKIILNNNIKECQATFEILISTTATLNQVSVEDALFLEDALKCKTRV